MKGGEGGFAVGNGVSRYARVIPRSPGGHKRDNVLNRDCGRSIRACGPGGQDEGKPFLQTNDRWKVSSPVTAAGQVHKSAVELVHLDGTISS